jgi:hypothetical protein
MAVIGKISPLEMFGIVKECIVVLPNVEDAALHPDNAIQLFPDRWAP